MGSFFILIRLCIIMSGLAVSLGWIGFVNRIAYGFSHNLSLMVNRRITTIYIRRIFALLSTYMDFRVAPEYDLVDSLPDQYLILSNHQSLLDIPLFMRYLGGPRLRFIAKDELGKHVPCVSLILRSDGHCLVPRMGSPSRAMKSMDKFAVKVMENNWIPVIFPEGTRSKDGVLGTFHAAGFRRMMDRAPMPVAVCAIDGGWRTSSLKGLSRDLRGGLYRIKILRIYPAPTTKAEQMRVVEEGKALIQGQIDSWRGEGTTDR